MTSGKREVSAHVTAEERQTIILDAGHGGFDGGAVANDGTVEKDINLAIATVLADFLRTGGYEVIMTRDSDVSTDDGDSSKISSRKKSDMRNRLELIKKYPDSVFVSIHLNSMPDINVNIRKNRGTSVYYYNENSKDIARAVQKSITKELQIGDDGIRQKSLKVLRRTEYLSFLVEAAYMTNPLDSVLYRDDGFAYNTAKAIADGILNYLTCD